ncbi:MAG: hypothetical protein ACO1RA_04975 [Planctomycetaceae bacterium]
MNVSIPFLRGKTIPLSLPRRFVCDLLSFAKQVPSIAMQKKMQLGELVEARARRSSRISWCAIFLKAYATVAAARPELRRAYLSFPWGRLYEHPENVASFSLEREYEGENAVFFARVPRPEEMSLVALDKLVRRHKQAKVESVTSYRQALLLSRLPLPLRRFIWWLGLCTDGMYRAHFFGTFAISVVASFGAASLKILSPLTTTLNYGTFEPDGSIDVRLTYDHRVMDGATVARAMGHLDKVLRTQILEELQTLAEAELEAPSESAEDIADVEQALAS